MCQFIIHFIYYGHKTPNNYCILLFFFSYLLLFESRKEGADCQKKETKKKQSQLHRSIVCSFRWFKPNLIQQVSRIPDIAEKAFI